MLGTRKVDARTKKERMKMKEYEVRILIVFCVGVDIGDVAVAVDFCLFELCFCGLIFSFFALVSQSGFRSLEETSLLGPFNPCLAAGARIRI
jgi:hypothetical protein